MPSVKIINPDDIEPMILDTEFHRDGRATHRRVVTKAKDGAQDMDAGVNTYKAGLEFGSYSHPDNDEICYIIEGRVTMINDGKEQELKAGDVMFRPKGAATDNVIVHEDMKCICTFAPARD